jgi:hypothetical protein
VGSTIFSNIAGLVTVRDLLDPFGPPLQEDCPISEASERMAMDAVDGGYWEQDRPSLVYGGSEVVGAVWAGDIDSNTGQVKDFMEEIHPAALVSASTTAFDAMRLLCHAPRPYYYVLDGSELVGTLMYHGLFKLPSRLCLFALTLELEQTVLKLLRQDAVGAWAALSDGRKAKARAVFERKFGKLADLEHEPVGDLLDCTCFSDKGRLLKKRGLVPPKWVSTIRGHFDLAEDIRNMCAHPSADDGTGQVPGRAALGSFIQSTEALLADLQVRLALP